ncbi:MAG: hypothetical protein V3S33_06115 [Gammaproteobacteria bacterium]
MNGITDFKPIVLLITLLALTACGGSGDPLSGRYVAFESFATNLVAGDSNGVYDIFVRDTQTGVTTRVSVDSAGTEGNGNSNNSAIR